VRTSQESEPLNALGDAHPGPNVLWRAELDRPPAGSLLVAGNLLLVTTQEPGPFPHQATLNALSLDEGNLCWQRSFEHALVSGWVAVQNLEVFETARPSSPESSEVLVLVATTSTDLMRGEGALVALDMAGRDRWRWAPGVQRVSAPAVMGDVACVTVDARTLVVLGIATGEEQASVALGTSASLSAPALGGDVAYVPCRGPHLLAVGLDGRSRWRFDTPASPDAWLDQTPALVGEHLFVVLTTGAVLALRAADGSLAWHVDVGPAGKPLSAPATDDERLFVGAHDGVYALALADGHRVWTFPTPRRITAAPVVTGGVVYATCHDHRLYALDAATGRKLWQYETERRLEISPVAVTYGQPSRLCVLVADRGGVLTAVTRPLGAEALEAYARSLEGGPASDEERSAAWNAAVRAFEVEGEIERANACREEVTRCLRRPVITLDVQHEGLVLNAWSRLQFIVRNEGYGLARNLVIRATGDEFEGQVMATRQIITLRAGHARTERLDVRPLEYGDSVPLRLRMEYLDHAGELCACEHTIYIPVARTEATRRAGTAKTSVFVPLSRQLVEAREHLQLICERKAQYVMETDIPLQLIKEERRWERHIAALEARLAQTGDAVIPAPAPSSADAPAHQAGGATIHTGGGAVILGNVTVEGGDFIGRDQVAQPEDDQ
jgi:outer membrane protein assembly factor BamB